MDHLGTPDKVYNKVYKAKMFVPILLVVLFFTIGSTPLLAATSGDAFLQGLQKALDDNPEVLTARANLTAAQERIPQSQAAFLPTVAMDIAPSHSDTGVGSTDLLAAGLTLEQKLYSKPALVAFEQTTPYIAAFADDLAAVVQSVFLKMSRESAALLQAREVVKLAANNVEVLQNHLRVTQARLRVGEITPTAVSQAAARLAAAQAEQVQAGNEVAVAQTRFREVVGLVASDALVMPTPRVAATELGTVETWLAQVEQRPDWRAARKRLEVAELAVEMERAGHWPTVALTSSAGHDWQSGGGRDVNRYSLGMRMEVPLFAGGMIVSKTSEAQARRTAQVAQLDKLRRSASQEVEQAYLNLKTTQALTVSYGSVVAAATIARDGVAQEFKVGARTALDLLDAQHELFVSQTDRAKNRHKLQLAQLQLLQAVGRLYLEELVFQERSGP